MASRRRLPTSTGSADINVHTTPTSTVSRRSAAAAAAAAATRDSVALPPALATLSENNARTKKPKLPLRRGNGNSNGSSSTAALPFSSLVGHFNATTKTTTTSATKIQKQHQKHRRVASSSSEEDDDKEDDVSVAIEKENGMNNLTSNDKIAVASKGPPPRTRRHGNVNESATSKSQASNDTSDDESSNSDDDDSDDNGIDRVAVAVKGQRPNSVKAKISAAAAKVFDSDESDEEEDDDDDSSEDDDGSEDDDDEQSESSSDDDDDDDANAVDCTDDEESDYDPEQEEDEDPWNEDDDDDDIVDVEQSSKLHTHHPTVGRKAPPKAKPGTPAAVHAAQRPRLATPQTAASKKHKEDDDDLDPDLLVADDQDELRFARSSTAQSAAAFALAANPIVVQPTDLGTTLRRPEASSEDDDEDETLSDNDSNDHATTVSTGNKSVIESQCDQEGDDDDVLDPDLVVDEEDELQCFARSKGPPSSPHGLLATGDHRPICDNQDQNTTVDELAGDDINDDNGWAETNPTAHHVMMESETNGSSPFEAVVATAHVEMGPADCIAEHNQGEVSSSVGTGVVVVVIDENDDDCSDGSSSCQEVEAKVIDSDTDCDDDEAFSPNCTTSVNPLSTTELEIEETMIPCQPETKSRSSRRTSDNDEIEADPEVDDFAATSRPPAEISLNDMVPMSPMDDFERTTTKEALSNNGAQGENGTLALKLFAVDAMGSAQTCVNDEPILDSHGMSDIKMSEAEVALPQIASTDNNVTSPPGATAEADDDEVAHRSSMEGSGQAAKVVVAESIEGPVDTAIDDVEHQVIQGVTTAHSGTDNSDSRSIRDGEASEQDVTTLPVRAIGVSGDEIKTSEVSRLGEYERTVETPVADEKRRVDNVPATGECKHGDNSLIDQNSCSEAVQGLLDQVSGVDLSAGDRTTVAMPSNSDISDSRQIASGEGTAAEKGVSSLCAPSPIQSVAPAEGNNGLPWPPTDDCRRSDTELITDENQPSDSSSISHANPPSDNLHVAKVAPVLAEKQQVRFHASSFQSPSRHDGYSIDSTAAQPSSATTYPETVELSTLSKSISILSLDSGLGSPFAAEDEHASVEVPSEGKASIGQVDSKLLDEKRRVPDYTKSKTRRFRREGSIKRGKWKLGAKIGSGVFGVVHVGMNTETGAFMAVKSLKMEPAVMQDAEREVDLLKSLQHENIVRYLGAEMEGKYLHIFQEWVPGGSVTSMLLKFGPFPIDVIRNYLEQILRGVLFLHESSIMHRDIKGSNILVNDEGVVKLADFGAGRRFQQLQSDMMMNLTMRGTPYFMAPEVFQQMYGMKADIWSVGCVAVQMATGNPPWKQLGFTNPVALFQHMISTKGAPMMELEGSPGLADGCQQVLLFRSLVETCFERQPEGRPTAGALLVDSFFAVEMGVTRDDNSPCRGLFSPESTGSSYYSSSPFRTQQSPLRPPTRRRNSRSSSPRLRCFSPPLPRSKTKRRQSQSPLYSPCRDASDWPTWAQRQLPFVGDASAAEDVPGESNTIKTLPTSDSFDSLVYSDDSGLDASGVSLVGLKFASTVSPQGDAIEVPGIERTGTTVGAASSKVVAARQT